jgi:hypothetical protein
VSSTSNTWNESYANTFNPYLIVNHVFSLITILPLINTLNENSVVSSTITNVQPPKLTESHIALTSIKCSVSCTYGTVNRKTFYFS